MSIDIVFSTSSDYTNANNVVSASDLVHNVTGGGYSAVKLYATNVGTSTAYNCGFYLEYAGQEPDASSLAAFNEVLTWSSDNIHGVYTIQGTAPINTFEALPDKFTYTNVSKLHTYTNGTSVSSAIVLVNADGTAGDELDPVLSGGSTVPFYVFVKIPAGADVGKFGYELHFYYEEAV